LSRFIAALAATGALFAGTAPAIGSGPTVKVVNYKFTPKTIHVARGATVTWKWAGTDKHNVTGKGWRSKTQLKGIFRHRFTKAGTYRYRCTIHAASFGMRGKIIVG
jgi:plastocyanin